MYGHAKQEENACANAEGAPDAVADLAEVCRYTTTAYSIAKQKHQVRGVTMNLCYGIMGITFMPRLVPFVKVHHSGCYHASDAYKHGDNER